MGKRGRAAPIPAPAPAPAPTRFKDSKKYAMTASRASGDQAAPIPAPAYQVRGLIKTLQGSQPGK